MNAQAELAEHFDRTRAHLRAVAYRMLGSADEADDAVQETWLRAARADAGEVANVPGWLTTIVGRICLDMLRARGRRDEHLVESERFDQVSVHDGDPADEAVLADSVGLALLVVLDTLSPAERVAFVLHDLFSVPFVEIGQIVERSPATAKKLASRARQRVNGTPVLPAADHARQRRLVAAFLAAARAGDLQALLAVLAPDVLHRSDLPGSAGERRGARSVAEGTLAGADGARLAGVLLVDGVPGIGVLREGRLFLVLRVTADGDRITGIEIVSDPARLAAFGLALDEEVSPAA
ncbi:sigma-70 family RNA polymerase sigma factor [Nonomuraea spiralis]|uniref:Sigma-70 family RNA polymerase sigma factor n=1 Tax=Nonomuraea spiralis TaxID=46182 RepID=A0ABV5ILQ1_9ACTN|nr:sigma-70 family RNA polymerase sigma factor [Nonomuraea spiralis]GGT39187.1 DNA-directed RNA polymerase sigma-70 factor [Nonomuraea spiralis]